MNVIGCGTGRCGTKSFARLINSINGWQCTHEMKPLLPWEFDKELAQDRLNYFQYHNEVADVAFYYLPYLEYLLEELDEIKVICLKRDKRETVESFRRKVPNRNHWADHDGSFWGKDKIWDRTFPNMGLQDKFSGADLKRASLEEYWVQYYEQSEWLSDVYPDKLKIYPIDVLNDRGLQKEMFEFIGIDKSNIKTGIRKNAS